VRAQAMALEAREIVVGLRGADARSRVADDHDVALAVERQLEEARGRRLVVDGVDPGEVASYTRDFVRDLRAGQHDGLLVYRKALRKDLAARASLVRTRVARIRERAPERVRETHEKMKERVRTLLAETEIPEDRLLMEIALLSDRLDCTEECVRLEAHCDHFLKYLDEESAPGRKLNFLLQEMNREINTIGSKSNDVAIVEQVVEVKEELERIREQVQNIE